VFIIGEEITEEELRALPTSSPSCWVSGHACTFPALFGAASRSASPGACVSLSGLSCTACRPTLATADALDRHASLATEEDDEDL
jgi:hypothetical protein